METILIHADNEQQVRLVHEFLRQHNLKSRTLTEEDKEDVVLVKMMEEADLNEVIDTETFIVNIRKS